VVQLEENIRYSYQTRAVVDESDASQGSKIWLVTFTDTMALMLTFFVLMFAMGQPKKEYWTDMATALNVEFQTPELNLRQLGPVNAINLDRVDFQRALDVDYLEGVLSETLKASTVFSQAIISKTDEAVILSFPEDFLFLAGSETLTKDADQLVLELATMLSQFKNAVIIHGHSDPVPVSGKGKFRSNWGLSLMRAEKFAEALANKGYGRDIFVRGFGDSQYDLLEDSLTQEDRYALSRRVDILILDNKGTVVDPITVLSE
jgi:chemotaxis protein MotB